MSATYATQARELTHSTLFAALASLPGDHSVPDDFMRAAEGMLYRLYLGVRPDEVRASRRKKAFLKEAARLREGQGWRKTVPALSKALAEELEENATILPSGLTGRAKGGTKVPARAMVDQQIARMAVRIGCSQDTVIELIQRDALRGRPPATRQPTWGDDFIAALESHAIWGRIDPASVRPAVQDIVRDWRRRIAPKGLPVQSHSRAKSLHNREKLAEWRAQADRRRSIQ